MAIEEHVHDNRYTRQDEVLRRLAAKSDTTHTHTYAAGDHDHDTDYAAAAHTHDYAASSHSHSYAATDHTHTATDSGWIEVTPGTDWDFTSLVPSGATTGRYRLLNGVVYLSGAVRCTNTGSAVAFTLPEGYRPAHLMRYGVGLRYSSGGTLRSDTVIRVDTNGEVLVATSVANDSTHFDGVCFPV